MVNSELTLKVKKYHELKADIDLLSAEAAALADEIKAEMDAREVSEVMAGDLKATYKKFTTTRLDSKSLKTEMPDLYNRYSITAPATRFMVA